VLAGSAVMICGAVAISMAEAPDSEQRSWRAAMERECDRYSLDRDRVASTMEGEDPLSREQSRRGWWEPLIVAAATGLFVWLAVGAQRPAIAVNVSWMIALIVASAALLVGCGWLLWRRTHFS
jgi:hypothetical protein